MQIAHNAEASDANNLIRRLEQAIGDGNEYTHRLMLAHDTDTQTFTINTWNGPVVVTLQKAY